MSNLGFLSIFYLLTSHPLASGERASLPNKKEIDDLKKKGKPLGTIESGKPLKSFDILAFSVSFENDYKNIVKILNLSLIPVYSKDRDETHPLVIGGGIATFLNPEPVADFFDAFLLGDSPDMLNEFIDTFTRLKGTVPKKDLLRTLSKIKGVYVPSLYSVKYNDDSTIKKYIAEKGVKPRVQVNMAKDLLSLPAYSYIISEEALFKDMFLIEISRGCRRFCRFCAAGYNYFPFKKLPMDKIKKIVKEKSSGKKIGLVSAAVSDYEEIDELCDFLVDEGKKFSVSSFRADSMTDTLLKNLMLSGHKTLTIAPEAGSQRMRDVIKKDIGEDDILNAAKKTAEAGILNIKLYYIIGLPFENDDDVHAIVNLTKKVRDIFLKASKKLKRAGKVTVSIQPFVPKPKTPFFFKGMTSAAELKKKLKIINAGLKNEPNISIEPVSVREAALEALLTRGDRRLASMIKLMAEGKSLKHSAKGLGMDVDFYVNRDIDFDEISPFDIIKSKMKKDFLINEYMKAKQKAKSS